ncbi:MAG: GumC family protein, partial [Porphyromonas pasteri]
MSTQTNRSNQAGEKAAEVNLLDIFFYLLRFWWLYLLSVGVVLAVALYRNAKQPYVYESSVKIFIKDASQRAMMDTEMLRYARAARLNMDNEHVQLVSRRVLERTVKMANANVFYNVKSGLRTLELYSDAPFSMKFLDTTERKSVYEVAFQDAGHVRVTPVHTGKSQVVPLNVPVQLGDERFIIEPHQNFNTPWEYKHIEVNRMPFTQMVRYYQHAILVAEPENRASTLTLRLQDRTKKRALDILLAQVSAYNQEEMDMRNQVSKNTADFVNERLAALGKELGLVEGDMERFLMNNRTLDFEGKVGVYNSRSLESEAEALQIETQLKLISYMLSEFSNSHRKNGYLPLNVGVPDQALDGYIAQYNQLKSQRDKLVEGAGGSTENPVITEYDNALSQLRKNAIESLNQQAAVLRMRLKDTQGQQSSLLSKLPEVSNQGREKADIDRRLEIRQRLYTELLNKREEYALRQAMTQDSAYVLDMDDAPSKPVSPNALRVALIAILIGLVLPSVYLIIRLLADNKVRSRKDVMDRVSIPFLGDIPKEEKRGGKKAQPRGVREQGSDETSEAFRVLRENMRFMIGTGGKKAKKVIFTSFGESAGKSYVSYNLAQTLTFAGHSVVLVDLDLRKGTLSRRIGLAGMGATEYLSNPDVRLDQILRKDPNAPKLQVITSGAVPPNPAELLLGERLDELAAKLAEQFDFVLFDNVPFGSVADAAIANRIADLTIFVLRAGRLDRRALPELQHLYDENILTNMSIVLNGATESGHGYGYGYG